MPDEVADERWRRFMGVAQGVSTQRLPGMVGREIVGGVFLNGDTELSPATSLPPASPTPTHMIGGG